MQEPLFTFKVMTTQIIVLVTDCHSKDFDVKNLQLQRTGLYHLSPTLLGDTTFLIYENININIPLGDVILMRMRYEYLRICRSNAPQGIAPIDLYAWGVLWVRSV